MINSKFRKAIVMYKNDVAGIIEENEKGYKFEYDDSFIKKNVPISLSLPTNKKTYESSEMFSFFYGLLPEGWYLDIVTKKLKLDKNDPFGILISTSSETVGAVWIKNL